jgi:hypothetical protein
MQGVLPKHLCRAGQLANFAAAVGAWDGDMVIAPGDLINSRRQIPHGAGDAARYDNANADRNRQNDKPKNLLQNRGPVKASN